MKIVYVINHSVLYGANISLLNLLKELKKKNNDVLVISGFRNGICAELEQEGIPFIVVKHFFSILPNLNTKLDYILFFPKIIYHCIVNIYAVIKLYFKLRNRNIDLIHTNIGPDYIGFYLSLLLGIKHVWHIREYQKEDFNMIPIWGFKIFRKFLYHSNVIAITQKLYDHFTLNLNPNKSVVIYNGIRYEKDIRYTEQKENYFLFAGRLEENKGIFNLLSAFTRIDNKSINLLVAGTGNNVYVEKLKKFVKEKGIESQICFLGFRTDIDSLMYHAKALIVPSKNEGFGRITAEAMFNGCLVIGYKAAGTQEILEEKEMGLLYITEEELVHYMNEVANNDISKYKLIISRAQSEAKEKYSIEKNAEQILNYYSMIKKENTTVSKSYL